MLGVAVILNFAVSFCAIAVRFTVHFKLAPADDGNEGVHDTLLTSLVPPPVRLVNPVAELATTPAGN